MVVVANATSHQTIDSGKSVAGISFRSEIDRQASLLGREDFIPVGSRVELLRTAKYSATVIYCGATSVIGELIHAS